MNMYTILVTGDRNWTEYTVIFEALSKAWNDYSKEREKKFPTNQISKYRSAGNILVIHGMAKGADKLAGQAAFRLGFGIRGYPANWTRYKTGAGPVRNTRMLKENKIDLVLAFHDHLVDGSKGTKDMVTKAIESGVPVRLYKSDGSFVELTQLPLEV